MFRKRFGFIQIFFDAANEGVQTTTTPAPAPQTAPAPQAAPTSVAAPWSGDNVWEVGPDGAKVKWTGFIDDADARAHVEAKGYKNPAELARANFNLTKMQRDPNVIVPPAADATPEQMNEFYTKLGRPEKPEGYEFKFPAEVKPDDGMLNFARTAFHEAGLTPKQAQIVADKWNSHMAEMVSQDTTGAAEKNTQEISALETRWGADLNKNMEAGRRVTKALGLTDDLINRVESSIGSAPLVELLAMIGRKSEEGSFMGATNADPSDPNQMTKEQAQAEIAKLQGDATFQAKYTDKNHPEHKAALEKMMTLFSRT